MKLDFRIEQYFGCDKPIHPTELMNVFREIARTLDFILGTKKKWYEQGYSRRQALQHQIFIEDEISNEILIRWERHYKKEYPNWTAGIWDGGPDNDNSGIDCYPSFSILGRRNNPLKIVISFYAELNGKKINVNSMLLMLRCLLKVNKYSTYLSVESGGYGFPDIIPEGNGCDEIYKKVFPDRISCGWMLYIPHILLPELIPEAEKVIPVMEGDKQKGTIVVSTEEIFDGNNKDHIAKSNDIEIRLLDLGMLPLMTEL